DSEERRACAVDARDAPEAVQADERPAQVVAQETQLLGNRLRALVQRILVEAQPPPLALDHLDEQPGEDGAHGEEAARRRQRLGPEWGVVANGAQHEAREASRSCEHAAATRKRRSRERDLEQVTHEER